MLSSVLCGFLSFWIMKFGGLVFDYFCMLKLCVVRLMWMLVVCVSGDMLFGLCYVVCMLYCLVNSCSLWFGVMLFIWFRCMWMKLISCLVIRLCYLKGWLNSLFCVSGMLVLLCSWCSYLFFFSVMVFFRKNSLNGFSVWVKWIVLLGLSCLCMLW